MTKSLHSDHILDELLNENENSRISEPEICQPACTAIQIALTDTLRDWGVHPEYVIGHSSGEIAAAYASGAIPAQIAIAISYYRGYAMRKLSVQRGGMAAVGMSPSNARRYLREGVTVACENSPRSVTLSGNKDVLEGVLKQILASEPDTFCRMLNVSIAYHSGAFLDLIESEDSNLCLESMQQPGSTYERLIMPFMSYSSAMVPFYSTVTEGAITDPSALDAAYWRRNLQSPVLFNGAVKALLQEIHGAKLFVEIGPHSTLSSPLSQILRFNDAEQTSGYIPTLVRDQSQLRSMLVTAGRLYANGAPVQLSAVNGTSGQVLTDLPTYPWLHEESLWSETRLARQWTKCRQPRHELLGARCLESGDIEPSWRRVLCVEHVPWLLDHVMGQDVIFPCAAYIAMAGEAIRQVTGSEQYTIRNLYMKTPLVLRGPESAELLTSLRPVRLTDTADSTWFEVTIMAYQNESWKKHCVGQVRAGTSGFYLPRETNPYPRSLPSKAWYGALKKRGFSYGPEFQRLENISASPAYRRAVASVYSPGNEHRANPSSRYALHPTIIDQSLQLFGVAMTHGIPRHLTMFGVPVMIESIDIRPGTGSMSLNASCDTTSQSIIGNASIFSGDELILSMSNATLVSVDDMDTARNNDSMIARLSWKPHIDLIPSVNQLSYGVLSNPSANLLARFSRSLITETADKVRCLNPQRPHLQRYQAWICSQARIVQSVKGSEQCPDTFWQVDHLNEAIERLELPQLHSICNIARKISDVSVHLMQNEVSPQDVAGEEESFTALSEFLSANTGCREFFSLLGHSNPSMRVLTVGIGDGFATMQALRGLTLANGMPMFAKWTVADISPDRISQEKERCMSAHSIEYTLLDISKDPLEQGLEAESYDFVIVSDAFDGDTPLGSALRNIYTVLRPGGRIFYQNNWSAVPLVTYTLGIFPRWWEQEDHKPKGPSLCVEDWKKVLQEVDAPEALEITSSASHFHLNTTILSKSRCATTAHRDTVALLYLSKIPEWARSVERCLVEKGYHVHWLALGQQLPPGADVISFIDLEGPFFATLSKDDFIQLQLLATQIMHSQVLWVTESSQISCNNPSFGLVLGFARTIRHEVAPHFVTLEIDKFDTVGALSVVRVLQHLHEQREHPWIDPDHEFALHEGLVNVSRVHWTPTKQDMASIRSPDNNSKALDIGTYGLLNSLGWCEQAPCALRDDEVEVDMKYVPINFRVGPCFTNLLFLFKYSSVLTTMIGHNGGYGGCR